MGENVSYYALITQEAKVDTQRKVLISHSMTLILHWCLFTVLCQVITVFGVASNIINIVCFVKQGFQDPVNVSLCGLAVSDLGCLITLMWANICYTPAFTKADLPFDPYELQYVISAWPHIMFSRISAWITAIITLERCLCIALPLKVREMVTPNRMSAIIVFIFILFATTLIPAYIVNRLGMKFFPGKNKTLIGNLVSENREEIEIISFVINNAVLPTLSFVVIIVCTILLVYKLRANSRWRNESSNTTQAANVSSRNSSVAKMVVMIAILFIACYSPLSIIFIGMLLEPRLSFDGDYRNTFTVLAALCVLVESVNSSSNIFIYFHMSRKYRSVFLACFRMKSPSNG